jgi:hypothetical protein
MVVMEKQPCRIVKNATPSVRTFSSHAHVVHTRIDTQDHSNEAPSRQTTTTTPARDVEASESTRTHLALDIHEARVRRLYETLELVLASFQSSRRVEEINVLRKNLRASRAKRRRPRSVSRVTHTMHRSIVGRRPARARRPPTPPLAHIAHTHNESSIHHPSTAPRTSHRPRRVAIIPRHATRVSRRSRRARARIAPHARIPRHYITHLHHDYRGRSIDRTHTHTHHRSSLCSTLRREKADRPARDAETPSGSGASVEYSDIRHV